MTLRSRLALGLVTIALILVVPLVVARISRCSDCTTRSRACATASSRRRCSSAGCATGSTTSRSARARARRRARRDTRARAAARRDRARRRARRLARPLSARQRRRAASRRDSSRSPPPRRRSTTRARRRQRAIADSISPAHLVPALERADARVMLAERELRDRTTRRVARAGGARARRRRDDLGRRAGPRARCSRRSIALWLTRSISEPVDALERGHARRRRRRARLPARALDATGRDEFGRLAASFREMSRQLAELDKLKAEFVSVASHELKTPINVILGYLQLLRRGRLRAADATSRREVLETLEAQAKHARAAGGAAARRQPLRGGRRPLEPRPVQLASHARRARARVPRARRAARRSTSASSAGRWPARRGALGRRTGSTKCSGNLLSNAFKFTPRGGRVELIVDAVGRAACGSRCATPAPGIPPSSCRTSSRSSTRPTISASASATGTGLGTRHREGDRRGARRHDPLREHARRRERRSRSLLPASVGPRRRSGPQRDCGARGRVVTRHRRVALRWRRRCSSAARRASASRSEPRRVRRRPRATSGRATLAQRRREARARRVRRRRQRCSPTSRRAIRRRPRRVEAPYWRALFKLDPANQRRRAHEPLRCSTRYLADIDPRQHVAEATALRRVAATLDADARGDASRRRRTRRRRGAAAADAREARRRRAERRRRSDEEIKRAARTSWRRRTRSSSASSKRLVAAAEAVARPRSADAEQLQRPRVALAEHAPQPARARALRAPGSRGEQSSAASRARSLSSFVAERIGDAEGRHAALPLAEQIAHAAQPQIRARDLEAVVGADEDVEPLASPPGSRRRAGCSTTPRRRGRRGRGAGAAARARSARDAR